MDIVLIGNIDRARISPCLGMCNKQGKTKNKYVAAGLAVLIIVEWIVTAKRRKNE
jgi:hypothetical protein